MSLNKYIKKFDLPKTFSPQQDLNHENLFAKPLTRKELKQDLASVNSNSELILNTRGGNWPEGQIDEDFNFLDLAWHEREFRENDSFAYAVFNKDNEYIGCFYFYPIGYRTKLSKELNEYDVDVSWWVTSKAYENGEYEKLFHAIRNWLAYFPFKKPYFSNREIPG